MHKIASLCLAAALALCLSACDGMKIGLPPIEIETTLASGEVFGPSTGIAPGQVLEDQPLLGGTCNIPNEDEIAALVKAELGDIGGRILTLEKVNLQEIRLEAKQGDFSTINAVAAGLFTAGLIDLNLGFLFGTPNDDTTIVVKPVGAAELLRLLNGDCGAAGLWLSGTGPQDDIVIDAKAKLKVYFNLGF